MRRLLSASVIVPIALGCLRIHGDAWAATGKCAVRLVHTGTDAVGQRLALALKERITASSRYRLVEDKAGEEFVAMIEMVSVDRDTPAQGRGSSVAVLLSHFTVEKPAFPTTHLLVLQLGSDHVTDQAERLLANLDQYASEFRFACDRGAQG